MVHLGLGRPRPLRQLNCDWDPVHCSCRASCLYLDWSAGRTSLLVLFVLFGPRNPPETLLDGSVDFGLKPVDPDWIAAALCVRRSVRFCCMLTWFCVGSLADPVQTDSQCSGRLSTQRTRTGPAASQKLLIRTGGSCHHGNQNQYLSDSGCFGRKSGFWC